MMQPAPLEPSQENLAALANVLKTTLQGDNQAIKQATAQLTELQARPQYSLCLLQLISLPSVTDFNLKQSAATAFKNFVLSHWAYEGSERQEKGLPDAITESDRVMIKQHIIPLMVSQPQKIQQQLGHALAIISRHDFPAKWNTLLPELVARFQTADSKPEELLGVLEVMHSIFYRYRSELKSQKLWEEIEVVLATVADPLSDLFLKWCARLSDPNHAQNPQTLPIIIGILGLIIENFFSLNHQEHAEQFDEESRKQMWFKGMLELLKYNNPILDPRPGPGVDMDEPTKLDTLKATICDIVNLFVWKYEDQFAPFVQGFVETIWNLLTQLSDAKRFDLLVNSSIKFLTSVVKKEHTKHLFNNEAALKAICEKVIIPQLKLRDTDLETFEMNPQEYIRMDIEGSDVDTRRRTSLDFIHGLTLHFESQISGILKGYVEMLLQEYEKTKKTDKGFLAKDAAMYIILALSARKSTSSKGITETNPYVDISSFFQTQVIPELLNTQEKDYSAGILKADCLKYVSVFRQQLPKEYYSQLMPVITHYLASDNVVVHTYAAYAIERILSVTGKDANGAVSVKFDKEALAPHLKGLMIGLFSALDHEESKENEYLMRGIMRVVSVGQDQMVPFAQTIIQKTTAILSYISQNPKNPKFNHCLFETIAALIKYLCKSNATFVDSFEQALFGVFQTMLSMESAAEFSPYVFQLLSQLLELRPDSAPFSQGFLNIFPSILTPALWLNSGNVPALSRLLIAYIHKPTAWASLFQGNTRFNGVMGIFQELLRLKSTEGFALELLTTIIIDLDLAQTGSMVIIAFQQFLFPKLQPNAKPTAKLFQKTVILFLAMINKHGFDAVTKMLDQIQPGIFAMLHDKIVLPNTHFLHSETERKLGCVVLANLAKQESFLNSPAFFATWPRTVLAAAKLVAPKESKEVAGANLATANAVAAEEDDADDLLSQSDKGFSTAYARLVFAAIPERDFVGPIQGTPKEYVRQQIGGLLQQFQAKLSPALGSLPQADQQIIGNLLSGQ